MTIRTVSDKLISSIRTATSYLRPDFSNWLHKGLVRVGWRKAPTCVEGALAYAFAKGGISNFNVDIVDDLDPTCPKLLRDAGHMVLINPEGKLIDATTAPLYQPAGGFGNYDFATKMRMLAGMLSVPSLPTRVQEILARNGVPSSLAEINALIGKVAEKVTSTPLGPASQLAPVVLRGRNHELKL